MKDVYSDNAFSTRRRGCTDYFAVFFCELEPDWRDFTVAISRYFVPGRCDYYRFDNNHERVRFSTEVSTSLVEAMKLLAEDLNRKQVADMLVLACEKNPGRSRSIQGMLHQIGVKSKATRAVDRWCKARDKVIQERIAARKAERQARDAT